MCVSGKMRSVVILQEGEEEGIKENDGGDEFNYDTL
jgi:hypothetical protein